MGLTRSLDKARAAFIKKDVEAMKQAHGQHESIHEEHGHYIKSIVYGGLDGIITTFAVVAGVAGAALSTNIILILGFANLIADGISMAIGDYLSTKAEQEYHKTERARETWEVEKHPAGEKKEMVELYMGEGVPKKDAVKMVNALSKHKKAWIDAMMAQELGIVETDESPWKNGITTFISFIIFGFIPLVTYIAARFIPVRSFLVASILTGLTLFTLGSLKVKITGTHWFRSGLEMFIVGGVAAAAAYGIGFLIAGLV